MIRTFHPIGQGAFYTEQFNGLTIVYDCGSVNEDLIRNEIENVFDKDQSIDAVFISHLHSDHVNGLAFLLKHCNVKKIFMPLLTENEKILLLIQNGIIQNGISPFLETLIETQSLDNISGIESVPVVLIPETDNDSELYNDQESIQIDSPITSGKLKGKLKFSHKSICDWVFIPFNFRQSIKNEDLLKKLKIENIEWTNIAEFKKFWLNKNHKNKIIEIFKTIQGSMNANSMTLYSGPDRNGKHFYSHFIGLIHFFPFYGPHHLVGCLYFGDYEAKGSRKWSQFSNNYKPYWDQVGTIQIPHHGSKYNYNSEINKGNPKLSIISSGIKNGHRHPHASTLKEIVLDHGLPLVVTENIGSRIMLEIHGI